MLSWNGISRRSGPQSWAQVLGGPRPERGFFLEGRQKLLGSQPFPQSLGLSQRPHASSGNTCRFHTQLVKGPEPPTSSLLYSNVIS